ncbi:MAG TPA: hypothetical protein VHL30_01625 [Chlamydiales bacterium]|jgi:hypothetical protein|nr:hypothetical protein [Chlamydiales bacterium]
MANIIGSSKCLTTLEATKNVLHAESVLSKPNHLAATLYKPGSFNLRSRLLALVQVIVSFVAVPFALVAMIFVPIITLSTHGKDTARLYAAGFAGIAAAHLFRIPECLFGALFPSTLTKSSQPEQIQQAYDIATPIVGMMFGEEGQAAAQAQLERLYAGLAGVDVFFRQLGPE